MRDEVEPEYFDDVIGVTVPDKESETIIIRVNRKRYDYIKTKPLHLSQRLIEENRLEDLKRSAEE